VRADQNVAGVRIGVEEAVDEKLVVVELDQILDHAVDVDVVFSNLIDIGNSEALIELHDEHMTRGHFAKHLRNDREFAVLEHLLKACDVVGFVLEVHLLADDARELLDDGAGGANRVVIAELFENKEKTADDLDVRGHQILDARSQHFYDDFFAMIAGAM